ncbi:MAG TPA: GNAT family N-acetyltransferase, partial [Gemmatimonadaceae bacterium]|nr:GNAT family N-acetyltransferase [Gemmatimonadaceae bacterium]
MASAAVPTLHLRPARPDDLEQILALYRTVASHGGGLARAADEITPTYVAHFLTASLATGVCVVAEDAVAEGGGGGALAGEIHAHALGPRVFAHVLGELTVAVNPAWQGRGVGRRLFEELLAAVARDRPQITRVELKARESNAHAIRLY